MTREKRHRSDRVNMRKVNLSKYITFRDLAVSPRGVPGDFFVQAIVHTLCIHISQYNKNSSYIIFFTELKTRLDIFVADRGSCLPSAYKISPSNVKGSFLNYSCCCR